ncbi:hypothetical protein G6F35_017224 [Rhizopus arrhizus]|nr:hypothetical protein G6F35_017224 [Rhizopus arrhizus]
MHGMGDYVTRAAGLDNAAGVHHRHAVRQARHDRQVVRDPDQARARLAAQLLHFKKDLPLDRHVQRRRGLIRNDQAGRIQQRDGDRYALPHAARQLVRIGAQAFLRRRDAHHRQRLQGALARLFARHLMVRLHGLDHLRVHTQHRIQRHHRVLEDHRDLLAPQLAPPRRRSAAQVFAV